MKAERVIYEVNSDGVKVLSFTSFANSSYVMFQRAARDSEDSDKRLHIEIDDQIRSAYVESVQPKSEGEILSFLIHGDNSNHLRLPDKKLQLELPENAAWETQEIVRAFFLK